LHDYSNNAVIATKDDVMDGNPLFLDVAVGNDMGTANLASQFFGGGEPTIADSTFSPTFTGASGMGYGDDGILHAGEMVSLDTEVLVGQRLILTPDFFGQRLDQPGGAGTGPAGTNGWEADEFMHLGWQITDSPFKGLSLGSGGSGWDAGLRMEMRGSGTDFVARIGLYDDGAGNFQSRDARALTTNLTDLFFTFDRISTTTGRIMAFISLEKARAGISGDNTQFYSTDNNYMNGGVSGITMTGDFHIYVYSLVGTHMLPVIPCTEIQAIPS
jgi:hypothetical protein